MQKIVVLFMLIASITSASIPAKNLSHIFRDDLSKIDSEMALITALEQAVLKSKVTQSQLLREGDPMAQYALEGGDISGSLFGGTAPQEGALLGIPGFLWGFCCSVVGVFLVYIAIDDPIVKKKEGRQAIFGCAAGTLLWVALYAYLVLWASFY